MKSLKQLAEEHKCDKAAEGHHTYDEAYEFHFAKFRDKPIKLLEIGAGGYDNPNEGGASLRMWKEFFTNQETQIYSIDIFEKSKIQEDRITIWQGSQSDQKFLSDVIWKMGGTADIIIDDGSHVNSDVIASFETLFSLLKEGGLYVVEDCQTAYWKHYGGGGLANNYVDYFMSFIHGLNYKEVQTEQRGEGKPVLEPDHWNLNITSINFYHNIIFIYKGDNSVTA